MWRDESSSTSLPLVRRYQCSLEQGDIFEKCPVFDPESTNFDDPATLGVFTWQERDVIVMTQSCDLVPGRAKMQSVLVCALWKSAPISPKATF